MKKFFKHSLFTAFIILAAILTHSCIGDTNGPNTTNTTNTTSTITMARGEAVYLGPAKGDPNKVDHIMISLTSKDLVLLFGNVIGTGELLNIYLLATPTGEVELSAGNYTIKPYTEGNFEAGTAIAGEIINNQAAGTVLIPFNDSKQGAAKKVTGGKIEIEKISSGFNITATVTIDKKEVIYKYSGKIDVKDGRPDPSLPYQYEDMKVTTKDYTYTSIDLVNNGVTSTSNGNSEIKMTVSNDSIETVFILYTQKDPRTLNGTYTIADTYAVNTALKSTGSNHETDELYPSYSVLLNEHGNARKIYFLVSGTITVDENGVTINTKSFRGSTIKGTYSGQVEI